jgi:hypothetical protein
MARLVDLDDVSTEALRHIAAAREARERERDEELRAHADDDPRALLELETRGAIHPNVVTALLREHLKTRRPKSIGRYRPAFPRRVSGAEPVADAWIREDPRRLADVVAEASLFCDDYKMIAEGVLNLADRLGIDEATADEIVVEALRTLKEKGTRHGR